MRVYEVQVPASYACTPSWPRTYTYAQPHPTTHHTHGHIWGYTDVYATYIGGPAPVVSPEQGGLGECGWQAPRSGRSRTSKPPTCSAPTPATSPSRGVEVGDGRRRAAAPENEIRPHLRTPPCSVTTLAASQGAFTRARSHCPLTATLASPPARHVGSGTRTRARGAHARN
jgi:hypothetical protein